MRSPGPLPFSKPEPLISPEPLINPDNKYAGDFSAVGTSAYTVAVVTTQVGHYHCHCCRCCLCYCYLQHSYHSFLLPLRRHCHYHCIWLLPGGLITIPGSPHSNHTVVPVTSRSESVDVREVDKPVRGHGCVEVGPPGYQQVPHNVLKPGGPLEVGVGHHALQLG